MGGYKSLPFATYDLAVYLPGGAVLLVLAQYTLETVIGSTFLPQVTHFGNDWVDSIVLAVLWLSASYLLGHLGAYLSSIFVEKFVHNALGYPSAVWLKKERFVSEGIGKEQFLRSHFGKVLSQGWEKHKKNPLSLSALLFLFPLWGPFIIFYFTKPIGFYDPKLPDGLYEDVKNEFRKVSATVQVAEGTRWEKLVEHFVANNCPAAYQRMYNYLVIYGAMRLLAFILVVAAWVIIIKSAIALLDPSGWIFSARRASLLIAVSFCGYFSMLAFAKFNRRFFEECVLALLLTRELFSRPRAGSDTVRKSWSASFQTRSAG